MSSEESPCPDCDSYSMVPVMRGDKRYFKWCPSCDGKGYKNFPVAVDYTKADCLRARDQMITIVDRAIKGYRLMGPEVKDGAEILERELVKCYAGNNMPVGFREREVIESFVRTMEWKRGQRLQDVELMNSKATAKAAASESLSKGTTPSQKAEEDQTQSSSPMDANSGLDSASGVICELTDTKKASPSSSTEPQTEQGRTDERVS